MDIQILEEMGLTKAEAKTYLVLLEIGSSRAAKVVAKTGLHRRTVYDAIERLIEKGLVSYIKQNNVRNYEAVDPKQLREILNARKDELEGAMPQLELLYGLSKEKQETTFYRGKKALKAVFNDQIIVGEEIFIFGASVHAPEILKYYFPHFDKERVKRKIKVNMIFDENAKGAKIPLSSVRYVPKEYSSPAATNIYGDKVAIVLWSEDPIAIVIKNKEIADGYKKYFDLLWKVAKS